MILEIADCANRIALEFEAGSAVRQANSLYKLDTLLEALVAFRAGLVEEFALYDEREAERQGAEAGPPAPAEGGRRRRRRGRRLTTA